MPSFHKRFRRHAPVFRHSATARARTRHAPCRGSDSSRLLHAAGAARSQARELARHRHAAAHTRGAVRLVRFHSPRKPRPARWAGTRLPFEPVDPIGCCSIPQRVVARGVNRRGRSQTSEVRNQKQKKKENRKRGNGKSKMGDGIHGVLATRNPPPLPESSGLTTLRYDARQK